MRNVCFVNGFNWDVITIRGDLSTDFIMKFLYDTQVSKGIVTYQFLLGIVLVSAINYDRVKWIE